MRTLSILAAAAFAAVAFQAQAASHAGGAPMKASDPMAKASSPMGAASGTMKKDEPKK